MKGTALAVALAASLATQGTATNLTMTVCDGIFNTRRAEQCRAWTQFVTALNWGPAWLKCKNNIQADSEDPCDTTGCALHPSNNFVTCSNRLLTSIQFTAENNLQVVDEDLLYTAMAALQSLPSLERVTLNNQANLGLTACFDACNSANPIESRLACEFNAGCSGPCTENGGACSARVTKAPTSVLPTTSPTTSPPTATPTATETAPPSTSTETVAPSTSPSAFIPVSTPSPTAGDVATEAPTAEPPVTASPTQSPVTVETAAPTSEDKSEETASPTTSPTEDEEGSTGGRTTAAPTPKSSASRLAGALVASIVALSVMAL